MFCSCFEHFDINVDVEMCIGENLFVFSGSWVIKIDNICYTCGVRQNYVVLNWSTFTGVLEHLEMESD